MGLPADLAGELAAFTDRLASVTDLGVVTRDKYRRSTAEFLLWLAEAREVGAPPTRPRGTERCATGADT